MYTYIYICIYMHIHTHIYICGPGAQGPGFQSGEHALRGSGAPDPNLRVLKFELWNCCGSGTMRAKK